jgi:hypothetical protein
MPTPPPSNPGLACGVERWFVKTLADSDATKVHPDQVTPISIRDLNRFDTHCGPLPESRAFPEEFRVFETTGRITFAALEADRDYHLALEDPAAPQFTIVIELADTDCQGAVLSPHLTTLASAKGLFLMLLGFRSPSALVGTVVRVRGVGFYDFAHNQRGRSANCIELHPITGIEQVSGSLSRDEELLIDRRFEQRMDPTRTPREMAIEWAEQERLAIEAYQPDPP